MKTKRSLVARLAPVAITVLLAASVSRPARADTSDIAGITIPAQGAAWDAIAEPMTRVLTNMAREEHAALDGEWGHKAEVFAWRGASYKPGRVSFVQMSLNGALARAGYTVRALDSNQMADIRLHDHFSSEDASLPFQPDIWKQPVYFVATDAARGRALAGVFLESKDALVLGLLPVKLTAKSAAPTPATPRGAIVATGPDAMKGVALPRVTFARIAPQPRTARGQVKDAGGKPIVGAVVHVESSAVGGFRTLHTGRTNAQGVYSVRVATGICRVTAADTKISYNGKIYGLPLHPADGNLEQFDSARGTVENFTLRTWGATRASTSNNPEDPKGYYGGSLRLGWMSEIAPGGTFEITLTPRGALLGGGGRTIIYRFENEQPGGTVLNNVPLGRYTLSARLLLDGEAAPVRLEKYGPETTPAATLTIDFEPVSADNPDFGYSGVRQFHVLLRP